MKSIYEPNQINVDGIGSLSNYDKIKTILNYGVMAPSTHNTQPWRFKILANSCQIFIDKSRQLPVADPLKRDMYISHGALLKNIELASKAFGILDYIRLEDQTTNKVAEVIFKNLDRQSIEIKEAYRPKLDAIRTRSNYRGPFKQLKITEPIRRFILEKGEVTSYLIDDKKSMEELAALTAEGLRLGYANPAFRREISSWINSNSSHSKKGIPGYALRLSMIGSHVIPKLIQFKDIGPKLAALNYRSFVTSSAVVVLTTKYEEPQSWIAIGQKAQEIFLAIEETGGSCSIYVAAIEMGNLRGKIKKVVGVSEKEEPQFLFCIGKPIFPKVYSPREKIEFKLVT